MIDFVIRAEDLRNAPPVVREWVRALVRAELALEPEEGPAREEPAGLAALTPTEAGQILEFIRSDYLTSQVFFELGRDAAHLPGEPAGLHRIAIADILRHTRLGDADHLGTCLDRINEAFRTLHEDPGATLFAFDRKGGLYVHDTTRRSIKALWQAIVTARLADVSGIEAGTAPAGPSMPLSARPPQ